MSIQSDIKHVSACTLAFSAIFALSLQAQTPLSIAIVGPVQIRAGRPAQFSVMTNGASAINFRWLVNGFIGGTDATGFIDASGAYSPSPSIWPGHSVTIGAESLSTPGYSASMRVRILNPLPVFSYGTIAPEPSSAFLLDVHGSGFISGSQLKVAGSNVATTLVSSTEMRSSIRLSAGTAAVVVGILNPYAAQKVPVTKLLTIQSLSSAALLSINPAGLAFGNVTVNTALTLPVTLTSTGTTPVTINSAELNGSGLTMSGATFPVTLDPNVAITLELRFEPQTSGTVTGQLAIESNSSNRTLTAIFISGTGKQDSSSVVLDWEPPPNSSSQIIGYRCYRASGDGTDYELLTPSLLLQTTFSDSTAASGSTYKYFVTSVESSNAESSPSNGVAVSIP